MRNHFVVDQCLICFEVVFLLFHSAVLSAFCPLQLTCFVGSCAAGFKRPLLSVDMSVSVSVCPQLWC